MGAFQHPNFLSSFGKFRQASFAVRRTSRGQNPGWYQEALELKLQLHLRMDGAAIISFYHDRTKGRWSNGPALTEEALYDSVKLAHFVAEAIRYAKSNGATSLGVVIHIADEFAITELKADYNSPGALAELRAAAYTDPNSILQDTSVATDQASWRVVPYPAAGSASIGTAITISQHYAPLIKLLRETGESENFPIITHALSAPLVALLGLSETIQPTEGKCFVAVLQYPWFTVLAFFNEHSDLRLIRTLQHRGLRRPTNFRNSLATSNAALEFVDPDLYIVALGSNVDPTLAEDLQGSFPLSRIEIIEQAPRERMPTWCPEPILALQPANKSESQRSLTFQMLRGEKWALQDFLPTPPEIAEIYPSQMETKLLSWVKIAQGAIAIPAILGMGYFIFSAYTLSQQPESRFDPVQASQTKARLASLKKEQIKIEHWDNLLQDRTKAWACMESIAVLFPEGSGILIKSVDHSVKPDTTNVDSGVKATRSGFSREWKISGLVLDKASFKKLEAISSSETVTSLFTNLASYTGSDSYLPEIGKRSLDVNLENSENGSYKKGGRDATIPLQETDYERSFDLIINQQFNATDPLAFDIANDF